jgi:nicotinamide-nucleotide amidase
LQPSRGCGDDELRALAARVGERLLVAGRSLALAESCTGGWVAKVVTDTVGCSAWFDRGFVTYTNESKQDLLGVRVETLSSEGAVSEATVREMALGALARSRASVSLAISGIAGPGGGSADKPVGTVWCAWAVDDEVSSVACYRFGGDRESVRRQAVDRALGGLLDVLEGA